jgi:hypothetical protein
MTPKWPSNSETAIHREEDLFHSTLDRDESHFLPAASAFDSTIGDGPNMARFTVKQLRVSSSNEDVRLPASGLVGGWIARSIKNNEIPIKMTDVVKNDATRGAH